MPTRMRKETEKWVPTLPEYQLYNYYYYNNKQNKKEKGKK